MSDNKLTPPKPTASDTAHAIGKSIAAGGAAMLGGPMAPAVGAAIELISWIVGTPLERRREEWFVEIGQRILALEARGEVDAKKLASDPVFTDTFVQATRVAIATSDREKIEALHNAVTNSALPGAPEAAMRQMFLRWVEDFNEWHLRVLAFFAAPSNSFEQSGIPAPSVMITKTFGSLIMVRYPDLVRFTPFRTVWRDIQNAGLIRGEFGPEDAMPENTRAYGIASNLGLQFLAFISAK